MPKVNFIINPENEIENIRKYVSMCEDSRIVNEGKEILKMELEEGKKILGEKYKSDKFLSFSNDLIARWKRYEKKYFKRVAEITEYKWEKEEYNAYLTFYGCGFADIPSRTNVTLGMIQAKKEGTNEMSIEKQIYVLAHELFHLYHFEIIRNLGLPKEATAIEIVESIPILVLFDEKIRIMYPSVLKEQAVSSYDKVSKKFFEIEKIWNARKDFESFMREMIELFKNQSK